jgi:predicted CoA-binding protein
MKTDALVLPTERRERGERLFGASTYRRLQTVKAQVDPQDLFRSNHPVRAVAPNLRKAA